MKAYFVVMFSLLWSVCWGREYIFCLEDQANPPFIEARDQWVSGNRGYLIDLADLAANESNITLSYINRPWKRCQNELKLGNVDGLLTFIYSPERDHWAEFPKTNGNVDHRYGYLAQYKVFTYTDSTLEWDGEKFNSDSAAVFSAPGYLAQRRLQDLGYIQTRNITPIDGLTLLGNERIDGYILENLVGHNIASNLKIDQKLKTLEPAFMEQALYVVFSKQRYAVDFQEIESFWRALANQRYQFEPFK